MITLKFYSKDGEKFLGERRYRVPSKGLIIGRGSEADVMLQDKYVSRKHSMIYYRNGNYYIRDLGSRNGTYVNGERVQETLIKEGDRIVIGNYEISFEISGPEFSFLDPKILIPTISLVAIVAIISFGIFFSSHSNKYSSKQVITGVSKVSKIITPTKKSRIELSDGASVEIPQGAIEKSATLTITKKKEKIQLPDYVRLLGDIYYIDCDSEITKPATIKLPINTNNYNKGFLTIGHINKNGEVEFLSCKKEGDFLVTEVLSFSPFFPADLEVDERLNTSFDLYKYGFHFANTSVVAYKNCKKLSEKGGVCWGMASVSLNYCYRYKIETPHSKTWESLPCNWRTMIIETYRKQAPPLEIDTIKKNIIYLTYGLKPSKDTGLLANNLGDIITSLKQGKPVLLDAIGWEEVKKIGNWTLEHKFGHAVVAYAMEVVSPTTLKIYIYDPNYPDEKKFFLCEGSKYLGLLKLKEPYKLDENSYIAFFMPDNPPEIIELPKEKECETLEVINMDTNSSISPYLPSSINISIKPGEKKSISFKIHAFCEINSPIYINLFKSPPWISLSVKRIEKLHSGDTKEITITIAPPINTTPGKYPIGLTIQTLPGFPHPSCPNFWYIKLEIEVKKKIEKLGGIRIYSNPPGANVYIRPESNNAFLFKGITSENKPVEIADLTPGTYIIKVTKPGYKNWIKEVYLKSGEIRDYVADLEKEYP